VGLPGAHGDPLRPEPTVRVFSPDELAQRLGHDAAGRYPSRLIASFDDLFRRLVRWHRRPWPGMRAPAKGKPDGADEVEDVTRSAAHIGDNPTPASFAARKAARRLSCGLLIFGLHARHAERRLERFHVRRGLFAAGVSDPTVGYEDAIDLVLELREAGGRFRGTRGGVLQHHLVWMEGAPAAASPSDRSTKIRPASRKHRRRGYSRRDCNQAPTAERRVRHHHQPRSNPQRAHSVC